MHAIRFAVPLIPPPSRLTPMTQRLKPIFDPIRAPNVLGGTAREPSSAAHVQQPSVPCVCARDFARRAVVFVVCAAPWHVRLRVRERELRSFRACACMRACVCVRECVRACKCL